MAHVYQDSVADAVFSRIVADYLPVFTAALDSLNLTSPVQGVNSSLFK
jgi:hypothetical protein